MEREKIKKEINKMLDRMQEEGDSLKNSFDEKFQQAKDKTMEARVNADKYIQENPERSVLMSAGIGALIGITLAMLMKKRCRHMRD